MPHERIDPIPDQHPTAYTDWCAMMADNFGGSARRAIHDHRLTPDDVWVLARTAAHMAYESGKVARRRVTFQIARTEHRPRED